MNINAVEYPFIAFSKMDYDAFRECVHAERGHLTAPRVFAPVSDKSLRCFIDKYHEDVSGFLTVFDNYLTLVVKGIEAEHFAEQLEKVSLRNKNLKSD